MAPRHSRRRPRKTRSSGLVGGIVPGLAIMFALTTCELPSEPVVGSVESSGAYVKAAVEDAESAARRAIAYEGANIWNRVEKELDSVEVILRKARDEHARIRDAHTAALAVLDEARASDGTDAAERIARIRAVLDEADCDVAALERTVATLRQLEIPGRR